MSRSLECLSPLINADWISADERGLAVHPSGSLPDRSANRISANQSLQRMAGLPLGHFLVSGPPPLSFWVTFGASKCGR